MRSEPGRRAGGSRRLIRRGRDRILAARIGLPNYPADPGRVSW
jgi:hypothetical protein